MLDRTTAAVRLLAGDKEPVRVASTGDLPLVGLSVVDGIQVDPGDRVLVKNQASPRQNGIYTASVGRWVRAPDAASKRTLVAGMKVAVQEGDTQDGNIWNLVTDRPNIGVDAIVFNFYLGTTNVQDINAAASAGLIALVNASSDILATAWAATNAADFASRAIAQIVSIPVGLTYVRTAGYAVAGDGGEALYKKVVSEPSHAGKFQSGNGLWWEIQDNVLNPKQFGAKGDSPDGVSGTDDAASLSSWYSTLIAIKRPGRLVASAGYKLGSQLTWDLNGALDRGVEIKCDQGAALHFAPNVATPCLLVTVGGGGAAFYTKIHNLRVKGNSNGKLVQFGREDFADVFNDCEFELNAQNGSTLTSCQAVQLNYLVFCDVDVVGNCSGSSNGVSIDVRQCVGCTVSGGAGNAALGWRFRDGASYGNTFLSVDHEECGTGLTISSASCFSNTWISPIFSICTYGINAIAGIAGTNRLINPVFGSVTNLIQSAVGILIEGGAFDYAGTPAVPASNAPVSNNTGGRVVVYIQAGVMGHTNTIINGEALAVTGGMVFLNPGDTIALTYSGTAPGWNWNPVK